eukprot:gene9984-12238_t
MSNNIQKIQIEENRRDVFQRRRNQLMRQAIELSQLCGASVSIVVVNNDKNDGEPEKYSQYKSTDLGQLISETPVDQSTKTFVNSDLNSLFSTRL